LGDTRLRGANWFFVFWVSVTISVFYVACNRTEEAFLWIVIKGCIFLLAYKLLAGAVADDQGYSSI
jgi:hypothetical protein